MLNNFKLNKLLLTRHALIWWVIIIKVNLLSLGCEIKSLETANTCSLWACWTSIIPNVIIFNTQIRKLSNTVIGLSSGNKFTCNDVKCNRWSCGHRRHEIFAHECQLFSKAYKRPRSLSKLLYSEYLLQFFY